MCGRETVSGGRQQQDAYLPRLSLTTLGNCAISNLSQQQQAERAAPRATHWPHRAGSIPLPLQVRQKRQERIPEATPADSRETTPRGSRIAKEYGRGYTLLQPLQRSSRESRF